MLIAHYIGPAKPVWMAHLGWWAIHTGQKGPFDDATHTEAIHAVHGDGTFTIASSSLDDKGVRVKERVRLTPGHWIVTDVPMWDVELSKAWYRCSISAVKGTAVNSNNRFVINLDTGTSINYQGDGVIGVLVWGAQLNQGDLQPYRPIVGAAV